MKRVGFVGLGTMGAGMVRNLMAAGVEVVGWNRTVERAAPLIEAGMSAPSGVAGVAADTEAVVACLGSDAAVRATVVEYVLPAMAPGTLLLDTGTTGLELTVALADAAKDRGIDFVGGPITGSKLGAEGGKLTFMVGGPEAAVRRAAPLFEIMGKHVVHVGEHPTDGQRAKYCLNMTQAVVLQGVLEGYALAKTMGVPVAKLAEIFANSAGKTGVGAFKTPYLQGADYTPHFRLDLMHKDLHLALGAASEAHVALPAARQVLTVYDQAVAEGLGPEDFLATAKLLERWARQELRDAEGE